MTETEKQELRVKVAELCPTIHWFNLGGLKWFDGRQWFNCVDNDPLRDLNACAGFEKGFSRQDWWMYLVNLREQFNFLPGEPRDMYFVHATATQRCQAFVKTMEEKR